MNCIELSLYVLPGMILTIIPRNHTKKFYQASLRTITWKKLRIQRSHYQKDLCYSCKKPLKGIFHLHHVNSDYGTLGQEIMECDVQALHPECHAKEHERLKRRNFIQKFIDYILLFTKRCYYSLLMILPNFKGNK